MGALKGLLPTFLALVGTLAAGPAQTCSRLKHLENGRTFFRYRGLYVRFTCNPGFKLHGHRTNSCLLGSWNRDPPVCVASGCSDPGHPVYGSSAVNHDGSFAVFTCQRGYKLYGSALLYCRGEGWNASRPICRESDIMSSERQKHLDLLRSKMEQISNMSSTLKDLLLFQYNSLTGTLPQDKNALPKDANMLPKEMFLRAGLLDKSQLEEDMLKNNRVHLEESLLKKYWSNHASKEAEEIFNGSYEEPAGYNRLVSKTTVPLPFTLPKTPAAILLPSSPASLSSTIEPPMPGKHRTEGADNGTRLTSAAGSLMFKLMAGRQSQEHSTVSPVPAEMSAGGGDEHIQLNMSSRTDSFGTSLENDTHVQISTTGAGIFLPARHPETADDTFTSKPSAPHEADSLRFPVTASPVHQESNLQHMSTTATRMTNDISTSWSGLGNDVISRDETSSDIDKYKSGLNTRLPNFSINEPEGSHNTTFTKGLAEGLGDPSTPVYSKEQRVSGHESEVTSSTSQHTLSVAAFRPGIYSEEQRAASNVSAEHDESSQHGGILLVTTHQDLQSKMETPMVAVPEVLGILYLGSGHPAAGKGTGGSGVAQLPHAERGLSHAANPEPVTMGHGGDSGFSEPVTVGHGGDRGFSEPVTVGHGGDSGFSEQASSGSNRSSSTRNTVETTGSTAVQISSGTSWRASGQADKTSPALGESPRFVPGLVPPGSHDQEQVGRDKQLQEHGQQRMCPYPPVPAHGTFYFRSVANPAPQQYRHFIQYACYSGYTLANGDVHSFCLKNGKWSGIMPTCIEETPCLVNNGGCSQLCLVDPQKGARCHCRPGFELLEDQRTCRDRDECSEETHGCLHTCHNTFGSFECRCGQGYLLSSDGKTCVDRDECVVNNGGCAHHCANSAGTFHCYCHAGFRLTGDLATCQDVDECQLAEVTISCLFGCINTPGSYWCHCPEGYRLDTASGHCLDIDECVVNGGRGLCAMECHNMPGSFRCSCAYGYTLTGDGYSCVAECPSGYRKQPNGTALREGPGGRCVDINECHEVGPGQRRCAWMCVNLPGSHRCICPRGYRLDLDGHHCKDVDECQSKNGGCSHTCINYKGGYKCACPELHRLSSFNRKKCQPVLQGGE